MESEQDAERGRCSSAGSICYVRVIREHRSRSPADLPAVAYISLLLVLPLSTTVSSYFSLSCANNILKRNTGI